MNKSKILSAIFAAVITVSAHAGPFGIEMGMKIGDIDKNAKKLQDNLYEVSVPRPHKAFHKYLAATCPSGGVYMVKGIDEDISTNNFGEGVKSKFNSIEEKLKKIYGKNKKYDFLRNGSIWEERQYWMMGLLKGDRTLVSFWSKEEKSKLSDNIESIQLQAHAIHQNSGYLSVIYQFTNTEKCIEENNAVEDRSL